MILPKKITPDRIRESIVQVFFTSQIPFEPLIGYLYEPFKELDLRFTNRPIRQQNEPSGITQPPGIEIIVPQYLFFNDKFKIQVLNGSLFFNCIGDYPGWQHYFSFVKDVVNKVSQRQIVEFGNRVGVRYISEFPNLDILQVIDFNMSLRVIKNSLNSANFKLEWNDDSYRIIVNLGVKLPVKPIIVKNLTPKSFDVSFIDIDVIHENLPKYNLNELFSIIESTHTKEKEIFFGLLKEDFLETLNPEY